MLSDASAFHTAIFDALCACLNLIASEGVKLIHEAYAEPENAPRPARNKNVIYWTVLQDPASDPVSTEWNNGPATRGTHVPTVSTTVKYHLDIVCYGPACETYSSRIPVPYSPQPLLLHEEEGSLWRRRADLTIQLRVRDEQTAQLRNSISIAPAVVIHRGI